MLFCLYDNIIIGQIKPRLPQCPVSSVSPDEIESGYTAGQVYPSINVSTLNNCTNYNVINSYSWMSYVKNGLTVTVSVTQNNGYTVRSGCLIIGDKCALVSQGCHLQPGNAGSISGESTVCHGQTGVIYSVPAITNATGYEWTLPQGATITSGANTNQITVSFSSSSTSGSISVYGTNYCNVGNGGVSPNYTITVVPLPVEPIAVTSNKSVVCSNDPGTITLTSIGGSGTSFRWFIGQCHNGTDLGSGEEIVVPSPSQYTKYYGCWETTCEQSVCKYVAVNTIPAPIVSIDQYPNPGQIEGSSIYLIADIENFGGDGPTYSWTGPNGWHSDWYSPSTGVYHGGPTGPYYLVFTSHEGCVSDTAEWYLNIDGGKKNAFLDLSDIKVKNDSNSFDVKMYPNPSSGIVYITLDNIDNLDVTIYDYMGKFLFRRSNTKKIDLTGLTSGEYFVKIRSNNKEFIKRIILK